MVSLTPSVALVVGLLLFSLCALVWIGRGIELIDLFNQAIARVCLGLGLRPERTILRVRGLSSVGRPPCGPWRIAI